MMAANTARAELVTFATGRTMSVRAHAVEGRLLVHHGTQEDLFLLMVQPPAMVAVTDIPPREYIFVLDVSGSMNGFPLGHGQGVDARLGQRASPH